MDHAKNLIMNKNNLNAKVGKTLKADEKRRLYPAIVDKPISLIRKDIQDWRIARMAAMNADQPSRWRIYNLYETDIVLDALVTSQIENRIQSTLGASFSFVNANGEVDDEVTNQFQTSRLIDKIITEILNTRFYGHSLIELNWKDKELDCNLIPRQNVIPEQGKVVYDYTDFTSEGVKYRELPEYGTYLLEFGDDKDLVLLNKAVPHVLFKRFAQSCWSELAEIYGIPPRVMKTDTQDARALRRGEKMMSEMGAAAWFIIDTNEEFEWAKAVPTNGDVYKNLINLCDNQISLLLLGAVIGQDTQHGSYSKEVASQNILDSLVASDMAMVEINMNDVVIPSLINLGLIKEGYRFKYEAAEDIKELWKMTSNALNHFEVDPEWVRQKFGIEVTGKRELRLFDNPDLNAESFFV